MVAHDHEILDAKVEPVEMIDATDPMLTPPPDATVVNPDKAQISPETASALVMKRIAPTNTDTAKISPGQGKVILRTTIGTDGGVQDVHLVSAEAPSLALPAFLSVSQWKFKPYRIKGEPVIAETTVEVDFPTKD